MSAIKTKRVPTIGLIQLQDFGKLQPKAICPGHSSGGYFRREDLGTIFFKSGFKNIAKATPLLNTMGYLIGDGSIYAMEHHDRLEIYLTYLRTTGWNKVNKAANDDTDQLSAYLITKLRLLASPFKLEVMVNHPMHINRIKLTFIKTPMLVVLSPSDITEVNRNVLWREMLVELYGNTPQKELDASNEALNDYIFTHLSERYSASNECVHLNDFWNYYTASLKISPALYAIGHLGYDLIDKFEKQIYDWYRFVVFYQPNGEVEYAVMRKVELDSSSI